MQTYLNGNFSIAMLVYQMVAVISFMFQPASLSRGSYRPPCSKLTDDSRNSSPNLLNT